MELFKSKKGQNVFIIILAIGMVGGMLLWILKLFFDLIKIDIKIFRKGL